ncbi:MAG: biotin--[acetyl-CoA-carboxylase] ligase [Candidatus Rokubacteria bacterium]|nr:biotin--[acetyl-CoA-carboxylase] ligase [Candidatus Rokubacteria bacterium]
MARLAPEGDSVPLPAVVARLAAHSSLPPPGDRIAAAQPPLELPEIIRLESVDSTQRHARELADDGAVDGTVVTAETQTAGRGRRGRVWKDVPGASVLMSVILRTSLPAARVATLSIAAGVAVAEALREVAGIDARLKWPNDVLVDGRKVAGVLLERHGDVVILGIGINVTRDAVPPDIDAHATSIARARRDASVDREAVLLAVVDSVARWRGMLEREGFEPVRTRWTALAAMLGRRVTVDGVAGIARGLDVDGALLIESEKPSADREVTRVVAGDVA